MEPSLNVWQQFILGVKSYRKANRFVFQNKLWVYFIYPIVISAILFYFSVTATESISVLIENYLKSFVTVETNISGLQYLIDGFNYLLGIGIRLVFVVLGFIISSYTTLIIMSPVMALLSERTEEIITGEKFPFKVDQFIKDVLRGVLIAIRNIFIETWFIFLCFIFSAIPIFGLTGPLFLLVISFYFYGFSLMDYVNERQQLSVKQSVRFIQKNKGIAIGNGMVFSLLLKIPFIGFIFAPVLGPVAAIIAILEVKGYTPVEIIKK